MDNSMPALTIAGISTNVSLMESRNAAPINMNSTNAIRTANGSLLWVGQSHSAKVFCGIAYVRYLAISVATISIVHDSHISKQLNIHR